jgi:hypothetical protein
MFWARSWRWASAGVFLIALAATVPTAGDFGLTWDEPTYRYSQSVSVPWWDRLGQARTLSDVSDLLDRDSLVYYWQYGRYGPNLHPPLAGQLCLLCHAICGRWMKDMPSRRLASVGEYSLAIAILFGFLARRYGACVGVVAAGSLLLMPRVYGDGHIAATDAPCLLLWGAMAVAFWNSLHAEHRGWWRITVGVLLGLAFLTKASAVAIVLPLFAWLAVMHLRGTIHRRDAWADWIDGVTTLAAVLTPLVLALREIIRLARVLPVPAKTDLYFHQPAAHWSGAILAWPLAIWTGRRLLARIWRGHPIWGVERPALETCAAAIAVAPIVVWVGNPLWWRETLPRLAHYLMLITARRGVLPDIPIFYCGQTYIYTLPWHNAWVLMAITVPAGILFSALVGFGYALRNARRDLLPIYFAVHLLTLPVIRMLGTPAHDGVRLFLPTFFFLAAMAGWGTVWLAGDVARLTRIHGGFWRWAFAVLVLGPAAWQLVRIHPYELSYYNELIGGPRGAARAGFELSYWYDAFNDRTIAEINARLPRGAMVAFLATNSYPESFTLLQQLGHLRGDLVLGARDPTAFPYVWLLTHEAKATAFTRLLFAMKPWYASRPRQLDGLRIASVADPVAVSRAWALELLLDAPAGGQPEPPVAPAWVRNYVSPLGWFWGEGVRRAKRPNISQTTLNWAHRDPEGLRSAARAVAFARGGLDESARKLLTIISRPKRHDPLDPPDQRAAERLLLGRPEALVEAVEIIITRADDLRTVLTRYPYTDLSMTSVYLDQALP